MLAAQRLPTHPLGGDDGIRLAFCEVLPNDWCRAACFVDHSTAGSHGVMST